MELSRYAFADAYILEELKRKYHSADPKGRIDLLQTVYLSAGVLPYEIAVLAVEDPNTEVRQWTARHGRHLDYGELVFDENDRPDRDEKQKYRFPERNLEERLKNDPDPFVRACLRENPEGHGYLLWGHKLRALFQASTHLERLALVRNPKICSATELVEKLFDPDDQEVGIGSEERKELIQALLTNCDFVRGSHQLSSEHHMDGSDWYFANEHFGKLWKSTAKWPPEWTGIRNLIYHYLGGPADAKAEAYKQSEVQWLRQQILEHCDPLEDDKVIELGLEDLNESCRELAFSKVRFPKEEAVKRATERADKAALSGLAENPLLSEKEMQAVAAKLSELGLEETAGSIDRRREEVRRARGLGTPAELFDADADNKIPIERRVTFIGRRFLSLEREIRERLREVTFQTTPPVPELTLTSYGVAILLFVVLGEKLGTWSFLVVLFAVLFIAGRWQMKLETTKQQNEEKKEQLRAKRYEYEYEG